MPKMSLLDITQNILSDMNSDEVNSITDTIESMQVAQIIKSTYYNIIDGRDWPHLYQLFQLTPSGDSTKPTHMQIPENVVDVSWVKYDCKEFGDIKDKVRKMVYKKPEDFIELLDQRDSSISTIDEVIDVSGVHLNIYNDRAPTYYTSFDNETIIFDAYDIAVDTTLQNSKTACYGKLNPSWIMTDTFVPDLPTQSFSYLLNEAKSTAFLLIKEMPNQKAEQHSITQRRRQSQQAWNVAGGIKFPNYGRKK
jgi:hypothetical protein